jgi:hypothetical protein
VTSAVPVHLCHGSNIALKPGDTVRPALLSGQQVFDSTYDFYDPAVVYLTIMEHLAERYALGAVRKFGGQPHIYEVRPIGSCYQDPEITSGFGIDQWCATMGEVIREVPLPGLTHLQNGVVMRTAGPASGTVPFATFPVVRPNSYGPRDVTLFRPAQADLDGLDGGDRKAANKAIELLRQGRIQIEAKERGPSWLRIGQTAHWRSWRPAPAAGVVLTVTTNYLRIGTGGTTSMSSTKHRTGRGSTRSDPGAQPGCSFQPGGDLGWPSQSPAW